MDSDRRQQLRVAAEFRVRFRTIEEVVETYTRDISRGGLFVATDRLAPVGTVVELRVELPGRREPASVIARVAFVLGREAARASGRTAGMGMEFLDTGGPSVAQEIAAYLASQAGDRAADEEVDAADILVVDDSERYRKSASEALAPHGHRLRFAEHGLAGLAEALKAPPELILSDVQMPMMDGWQLLRMIRSRPTLAHVPVVFLTTLGGEADRLRGYQLGVDDYIAKPFSADELTARVHRILRRLRHGATGAARNALRGDLSQVSLTSVLGFIQLERRTGLLIIIRGSELATLHIRDGNVVQVDPPPSVQATRGRDRLFALLGWHEGTFELSAGEVTVPDSVGEPTQFLLMEHARVHDEREAMSSRTPR